MTIAVFDDDCFGPALKVLATTGGGDSETVELTAAEADNVYTGAIAVAGSVATIIADDGLIQGFANDSIKISYVDQDDGKGGSQTVAVMVALECGPPVIPADQVITFAALPIKTYGDASFVLNASASSGLPVEFISLNPSVATVKDNTVTIIGAGVAIIRATQPGSELYDPAIPVDRTLIVKKKLLAVTARDQTKRQGEPNPELIRSYIGFADGDDESMLDALPTIATTAATNSLPGIYPITLTGGDDDNYDFLLVNGTLTIGNRSALPFIEDFSSDDRIDRSKTTAEVNTEEQRVRLAWASRIYPDWSKVSVVNISDDQDRTLALALGDVDGDGILDVVAGNSNRGVNKLYLNTGLKSAPFADVDGVPISDDADNTFSIAIGDVDSDGDLDVVSGNGGNVIMVYLNSGMQSAPFADVVGIRISFNAIIARSIALGDVDGDGDLDIVAGSEEHNRLYLNNGTSNPFESVTATNISSDIDWTNSIALGDIDSDGDLDVVAGNSGRPNRLYLNNGTSDPFAGVAGLNISDFPGITQSIALGDVDGDGDLDVVTGNFYEPNRLYLNNGTTNPSGNVTGLNISDDADGTRSIALGDVDGDGDLDVIAGNELRPNRLYLNNGTSNPFANVTGLNISDDADAARFVTLADVDGDGDLDIIGGGSGTNRLYVNNGTSNPFANVTGLNIIDFLDLTRSIALGDVDGDGDLDVIAGNENQPNRLYLNNGTSNPFANITGMNISEDVDSTESIALGDVDGDGDFDVVAGNNGQPNRLYLNNGTSSPFAAVTGMNISDDADTTYSAVLGDIDGDGDLDVVTGNSGVNRLYLNNGTGDPFVNVAGINISDDATRTESVALGDVDSDGELDVVAGNLNQADRLYLNNGTNDPFASVIGADISDDAHGTTSVALGDVDGDDDPDMVTGGRIKPERLYLNNGTSNPFANVTGMNLSADTDWTESIALGDVDDDGDLDVVTGNSAQSERVFLNNGTSGPFADAAGISFSDDADLTESIALGDVDNDGDLDVVVGNYDNPNRVYLNPADTDRQTHQASGFQTHKGIVESLEIDTREELILSATLTAAAVIPSQTRIDFYLSNNDGQTWNQVALGAPFVFPTSGNNLRWKALLHSLSPALSPTLTSIMVSGNSAPTDIVFEATFIAEHRPAGSEIGSMHAIDIDGGIHEFSLVDGFGSDDNALFAIEGDTLKSAAEFDFEKRSTYFIRVRVDDGGGIFEEQVTIGIIDANEKPIEISLSDNSIEENRQPGATIGVLDAEDIDAEDFHFFTLPEGHLDNELFAVEGVELKTNVKLDFETKSTYNVRIRATDSGGEFHDEDLEIAVTDVSDSVFVNLRLSAAELTLGRSLTLVADISPEVSGPLNASTVFRFSGPGGFADERLIFSSEGGVASVTYVPAIAGDWDVAVEWAGTSDFDPGVSDLHDFTVSKSDTILELFFLGVPQILGQGRRIPGRLVLNNGNPGGVDLSGLEISATIGQGTNSRVFMAATDGKGNFELVIPADFFDEEGNWDVTAEFAENPNLNAGTFDGQILVRQKHGYAILVQGSIANSEGADEHRNTLAFVLGSLTSAGFGIGFDSDIRVIERSTPNPRENLRDAIENWAKEKMLEAPAPLYVVLANHGSRDLFHMHPDTLSAKELDNMLDNLQRSLAESDNSLAEEQALITILGMCFSGSFIDDLSDCTFESPGGRSVATGNNRIVISAAAPDEFSIRGTDDANERQGEQFVYLLFKELNKGLSLADSFRNARTTIRLLSAERNLAINSLNRTFPGEKGQHPLLDDNGDGVGSSILLESVGDGALSSTVFLTQPTNAIPALAIDRVSATIFLESEQPIPTRLLSAEIDLKPEEIKRIWMEVKKLTDADPVDANSTMQHSLEFSVEPMDFYPNGNFVGYEWPRDVADPNPFGLFLDPGVYQVFFYAEPFEPFIEISDPVQTFVYRASGDIAPSGFGLLQPQDEGTVDYNPNTPESSGLFTWQTSMSTGGEVKYIYRLWGDENRTFLIIESDAIIPAFFYLSPEVVEDAEPYWWDVLAVDAQGNFVTSDEIRQFTVYKPNSVGGLVHGRVMDSRSGEPLTDYNVKAVVVGKPDDTESSVPPTLFNGRYNFLLVVGNYNFTATATGYLSAHFNGVVVESGSDNELDFALVRELSFSLDIDGNGIVDALTDGILVLRYLQGIRGPAFLKGGVSAGCDTRCSETAIVEFLDSGFNDNQLDVDGDSTTNATTDGLIVIRYMFGFRNDALIRSICDSCDSLFIQGRLDALQP